MSTTRVLPSETPRSQACGETDFLFCDAGAKEDAARKRTKPHTKNTQARKALAKVTDRFCIRSASCSACYRGETSFREKFLQLRVVLSEANPSPAAADEGKGDAGGSDDPRHAQNFG